MGHYFQSPFTDGALFPKSIYRWGTISKVHLQMGHYFQSPFTDGALFPKSIYRWGTISKVHLQMGHYFQSPFTDGALFKRGHYCKTCYYNESQILRLSKIHRLRRTFDNDFAVFRHIRIYHICGLTASTELIITKKCHPLKR